MVYFTPSLSAGSTRGVTGWFFENIYRLHGLPASIIADHDTKITSQFWQELMNRRVICLKILTSQHSQTDKASAIMNCLVEIFLQCYCGYHQLDCDNHLVSTEFASISAKDTSSRISPFWTRFKLEPQITLGPLATKGDFSIEGVIKLQIWLSRSLEDANFCYQLAQARQAAYSSTNYIPSCYTCGDIVFSCRSIFKEAASKTQLF